jgi:hypothetical protein
MNNAYLTTGNSLEIVLYDKEETIDMFGEDMLNEYGCKLPSELVERYTACMKEFGALQIELGPYYRREIGK